MPVFVPAVPLAPPAPSVCHSVRDRKGYGQLAYISLALIQGETAKKKSTYQALSKQISLSCLLSQQELYTLFI